MEKTFKMLENINDEQWQKMDKIDEERYPFDLEILSKKGNWAIIKISIAGFDFVNNLAVRMGEKYRFGKYGIKLSNFEGPIVEMRIFTEKQFTDIFAKGLGFI